MWSWAGSRSRRIGAALVVATLGCALFATLLTLDATADLRVCGAGPGAGQCSEPQGVALDAGSGRLYVLDSGNERVDVFDAESHEFLEAFGADVISDGAGGTGDLTAGSARIGAVKTTSGAFEIGQAIDGAGIAPGTTITGLDAGTIALSQPATADGSGVALQVAEGPGNMPSNEVQTVSLPAGTSGGAFSLVFRTPNPSPSLASANSIAAGASAAELQAKLVGLSNIDPGDVSVSGPAGGPWEVEFSGRYADTDVEELIGSGAGLTPPGAVGVSSVNAPETCTAATTCKRGAAGSGPGQFAGSSSGGRPSSIALDGDPASGAFGDLYVFDGRNRRVERFHPTGEFVLAFGSAGQGPGQFDAANNPLALGPGGVVYVGGRGEGGQSRVQEFDSSGGLVTELRPLALKGCGPAPVGLCASQAECEAEGGEEALTRFASALAVDAAGEIFLATDNTTGAVRKYDAAGDLLDPCAPLDPSFNIHALASGPEGELLVGEFAGVRTTILRYDADGALSRVIYGDGTMLKSPVALAREGEEPEGSVFAAAADGVTLVSVPPPGPLVFSFKSAEAQGEPPTAREVSNTKATLRAEVNPEGAAVSYRLQYLDRASFEEQGDSFEGPATRSVEGALGSAGDFALHSVEREIGCPDPEHEAGEAGKCLRPETEYLWRVLAENAGGAGNSPVPGGAFTTRPSLEFGAAWSTGVGGTQAKLHGEVNPQGIPASGWLEYVDEASYRESGFAGAVRTPTVDLGGGEALTATVAQLGSLTPGTLYHYRLAAQDALVEPLFGPERTFATFGPRPPLPACPNDAFRTGASAALPDCRAYEMVSPVDKAGGDIAPLFDSSLDQAAADGQSVTYTSYRSFAEGESAPLAAQYLSRRGAGGWSVEALSPPRRGPSYYGRHFLLDNQFKLFSEDLCSAWLLTESEPTLAAGALSGYPNLYRRENCGAGAGGYEALSTTTPVEATPAQFVPKPQGFSADGSRAFFTAEGDLSGEGTPCTAAEGESCTRQLYEHVAGAAAPRLVCVLPDGAPSGEPCAAGRLRTSGGSLLPRSDEDYQAVSADGSRVFWTEGAQGPGPLYARINPARPQGAPGACEAARACTLAVSLEAASFRSAAADGSRVIYTESGQLFEFDVDAALVGEAGARKKIAGEVPNVLGASRDARRVYFVSREALSGEEENAAGERAQAGEPNLYLHDSRAGGSLAFIGALSESDPAASEQAPGKRSSRVAADGEQLLFAARAPLSGYDNADAASGQADEEVFLYDAAGGQLHCVSCNPSGERPAGVDLNAGGSIANWVAATIPGWTNGTHFSHALSDGGDRLFFESVEQLVPRDTNGAIDVYEWERASGAAQCAQKGADLYSAPAGGCISLISGGKSPADSSFLDASADGTDVFIETQAGLLPQDPGLIDVYDARAGGGFLPAPAQPSSCEGEACQSPPPAPEPASPASAALSGQGNLSAAGGPVACLRQARAARRTHLRARRLARLARRAEGSRARRLRQRSRLLAHRAKRHGRLARRCRARARRGVAR